MNGAPWSDMELQTLYEAVNDLDWFETVRPWLPGRSDAAIHRRMCQLREEAGIVPANTRCKAKAMFFTERQRAAQASERLRKAIERVA